MADEPEHRSRAARRRRPYSASYGAPALSVAAALLVVSDAVYAGDRPLELLPHEHGPPEARAPALGRRPPPERSLAQERRASRAPRRGEPLALDLPPRRALARNEAVRARFGRGPVRPLGPGFRTIATTHFLFVADEERSLPAPPWSTDAAYAEAFELARGAWASREPDGIRILIVCTTFEEGGRSLFYVPLANYVRGLGEGDEARIFDATPDSSLEGYVWMGRPEALEAAEPGFSTEAFLHEIAHRFGVYIRVDVPGLPREVLLGRRHTHWSFFADTRGSPMEGNPWTPDGEPDWYRVHLEHELVFSPLDLYLMGVLPPEAVPPTLVLLGSAATEPPWFSARPEEPPARRLGVPVRVRAPAVAEVTIHDVIRAAGPRDPPASPAPVVLPIGVVLLGMGPERPSPDALASFGARVAGWVEAFSRATGGRLRLFARLASAGDAGPGEPCRSVEDCDRTRSDRCEPEAPGASPVCTRPSDKNGGVSPEPGEGGPLLPVRCDAPFARREDAGPAVLAQDTSPQIDPRRLTGADESCACRAARAPGSSSRIPAVLLAAVSSLRALRRRGQSCGAPCASARQSARRPPAAS